MKKLACLFILATLLLSNCKKEIVLDEVGIVMSKVKYTCKGISNATFFKAKVGDEDMCISLDSTNPAARPVVGIGPSLVGASLGKQKNMLVYFYPDRGYASYKPIFIIDGPSDNESYKLSDIEIYDKYLKQGVEYPIKSVLDRDNKKFTVTLEIDEVHTGAGGCSLCSSGRIYFSTSESGEQAANAKLVFDQVERLETATSVTYNVQGHFNCRLFRWMAPQFDGVFYREVKDAEFKYSVSAKK